VGLELGNQFGTSHYYGFTLGSGQVGLVQIRSCQKEYVLRDARDFCYYRNYSPCPLYLLVEATQKPFEGDLYSLTEMDFCFSSSAGCLQPCNFALPLMDSSFRFLLTFLVLLVYKIKYNFVFTIV